MRQGQNPAKMGLKAAQPKLLGVCLLSYIPMLEGYYKESLDVLKAEIISIHATTTDFDLIVFDNGSCEEVTQELFHLYKEGFIHYLILSHFNIGKTGALNWILSSVPNEWICYSDGDMIFRKDWFEKSKEIFLTFPNVGLVNAQPIISDVLNQKGKAINDLPSGHQFLISEETLSPEIIHELSIALAISTDNVSNLLSQKMPVLVDPAKSVKALIGAAHDQFLTRKEIARQIVPVSAQFALSRIEDKEFNQKVDDLGFLQLSVMEPLRFHIGNKLDPDVLKEIESLKLENTQKNKIQVQARTYSNDVSSSKKMGIRWLGSLTRLSFFDRLFRRFYNLLFEYYAK